MAINTPFWTDAMAGGMRVGDALGDRFSQWNAGRKAKNLREELEGFEGDEMARQRLIDERMSDIESGPMRRGLDVGGYRDTIDEERNREIARQSAERRTSGDYESAYGLEASRAGALGDVASAQRGLDMAQQVRGLRGAQSTDAMTGISRPDYGRYEAGQESYYAGQGRADAAQQAGTNASTWRMKAVGEQAGLALNELMQSEPNPNVIAAYGHNMAQNMPEVFGRDPAQGGLRLDGSTLHIFRDGKSVDSFDLKNPTDKERLVSTFQRYQKNPAEALNSAYTAQLEAAKEARGFQRETEGKVRDKMLDMIGEYAKPEGGLDETKLLRALGGGGGADGGTSSGIKDVALVEPGQIRILTTSRGPVTARLPTEDEMETGTAEHRVIFEDANGNRITDFTPAQQDATQAALLASMAQGQGMENLDRMARGMQWAADIAGGRTPRVSSGRSTPGGAASGEGNRPTRNNNPGNIRDRGQFKGQPGYRGSDGEFAMFDTPEAGWAAMEAQLGRYLRGTEATGGKPVTTLSGIISTWAPPSDGNDTEGYIASVAERMGIDPDATITPDMVPQLAREMAQQEGWQGGTEETPLPAKSTAEEKPTAAAKSAAKPAVSDESKTEKVKPEDTPIARTRRAGEKAAASADTLRDARSAIEAFDAAITQKAGRSSSLSGVGGYGAPMSRDSPALTGAQRGARAILVAARDEAEAKARGDTVVAQRAAQELRRLVTDAEARDLALTFVPAGGGAPISRTK